VAVEARPLLMDSPEATRDIAAAALALADSVRP
jgi:LPPG:FO 2-phospho-L-lactate transferase